MSSTVGSYNPLGLTKYRIAVPNEPRSSPDESVLLCKAGTLALKGNLHDQAVQYFQQALVLNPFLWEAVEGLCKLGECSHVNNRLRLMIEDSLFCREMS